MRRREFGTGRGHGRVADHGKRAEADAGDRLSQPMSGDPFPGVARAFLAGLEETGHIAGQNVTIEYRWAEGQIGPLAGIGRRPCRPQGRLDRH